MSAATRHDLPSNFETMSNKRSRHEPKNETEHGQRRSCRRRTAPKHEFKYDSFKETQILQQALKASLITKHENQKLEIPDAPVFRPTMAEFMDPYAYIEKIREEVEYDAGICKIIPPAGWNPLRVFSDEKRETFRTRIQQIHRLQEGVGFDINEREFTIKEYKQFADDFFRKHFGKEPGTVASNEIEECYWKIVRTANPEVTVEYGNDIDASVFGSGFPTKGTGKYVNHPWNLNNIARLPGSVIRYLESGISGVTVPWVYFGMLFTSFCWHAEDLWMYSVNYNHFGAPKIWYGAPGCDYKKVEAALKTQVPELFEDEPDLAMQLVTQILPATLLASDVTVVRTCQNAGEFIITFPRAFHAGFNEGFNCTEAVNFATIDWLEHGRCALYEYRRHAKPAVFAPDKLLIELIQNDPDHHDKEILRNELKLLIDTQKEWRDYWTRNGISNWTMLPSSTNDPIDHCDLCNQFCFLSFLRCSCDAEKVVCLQHIGESSQFCKCEASKKSAYFRYKIDELLALNESLISR